ncbi:hypothetical protein RYX36_029907, partial [Vicia faba]
GRAVPFDRNSVSQYLSHPLNLQRGELCSYQKRMASKKWRLDLVAISGHSHGNKTSMNLGFPDFIMGLCRKTGVDILDVATKRISSIVNEDYVLRNFVPKLTGEAAPQPRAHAPLAGPIRYNDNKHKPLKMLRASRVHYDQGQFEFLQSEKVSQLFPTTIDIKSLNYPLHDLNGMVLFSSPYHKS